MIQTRFSERTNTAMDNRRFSLRAGIAAVAATFLISGAAWHGLAATTSQSAVSSQQSAVGSQQSAVDGQQPDGRWSVCRLPYPGGT
jgi:hypothetical protein